MRLTIIEYGPPVKHDTILYRTLVLLYVLRAIYTGPIHLNHELFSATPNNIPPDTNFTLQHLLATIKYIREKQSEAIPKIRVLARIRQALRLKIYSCSTEKASVSWIKRFILFHNKRLSIDNGRSRDKDIPQLPGC